MDKKKILAGILSIVSVAVWIWLFHLYYVNDFRSVGGTADLRKVATVLTGVCYVMVFLIVSPHVTKKWKQILLGAGTGLLFMVQIILLNNLNYFLTELYHPMLEYNHSYFGCVKDNLLYQTEIGSFEYPLCFVIVAGICIGMIFDLNKMNKVKAS